MTSQSTLTAFQCLCVESYTNGQITDALIADAAVMFPREAPQPSVAEQIAVERQIMRTARINVSGYIKRILRLRASLNAAIERGAPYEIIGDYDAALDRTESLIAERVREHHECARRLRAIGT